MPMYIVRPRFSVDDTLSLASRFLTRGHRAMQLKDLARARASDAWGLEVKKRLTDIGALFLTKSESDTPVTGSALVDMPDEDAERMRRELPDTVVLRDQPMGLIEPRRAVAAAKKTLAAADLWHLKAIGLEAARKAKKKFAGTGKGVTVAVLDTGIDADHPEIGHAVKGAYRFDTQGWIAHPMTPSQDTDGHGTHVAGLIAGKKVGVAPAAQLLSGVMIPQGRGNLSDFVLALEWCAAQPEVQIVNMSAGIRGYLDGMQTLIADLMAVGILPVVATGNEGRNKTRSPGNYTEVISVGATDKAKHVSSFSSGAIMVADSHQYHVPDLVAPGEGVYSSVMGGGYEAWDGTSMATPIVSGVAALILERHPDITVGQLQEELLTTCVDLKVDADRQGKGLVQIKAAL